MLNKNTGYVSGNLIVLQPITKDANDQEIPATFKVLRKGAEDKMENVDNETVSSVTGDIFRLETYKNEWDNPKTKKKQVTYGYKVMMRDDVEGEVYIIDARLNLLTRDLANKLMGLTKFTGITVGVYRNKKTGFNTAVVKTGENKEDLVGWKFNKDEIPKPIVIKNPVTDEVLQRVYTEVDEFYINALNSFSKENDLVKKDQSVAAVRQAVQEEESEVEESDEVGSSDGEGIWE